MNNKINAITLTIFSFMLNLAHAGTVTDIKGSSTPAGNGRYLDWWKNNTITMTDATFEDFKAYYKQPTMNTIYIGSNKHTGTLTLTNSSIVGIETLRIGQQGNGTGTVILDHSSLGSPQSNSWLVVGGSKSGSLILRNGSSANLWRATFFGGSTLDISDSEVQANEGFFFNIANGQTSTVNIGKNGILNLNSTGAELGKSGQGSVNFALNDGTINANQNITLFKGFNHGDNIQVNGNSTINVAEGKSVTVPENAVITGGGTPNSSFTKAGLGTLNLNSASTYEGNTIVHQGTLSLSAKGSLPNSNVTVENNATLAVGNNDIKLGALNVNDGGRVSLSVNNSGIGKILVKNDVNIDENAVLFFDVTNATPDDLNQFIKNNTHFLNSENGSINGKFRRYEDNSIFFTFVPVQDSDSLAFIAYEQDKAAKMATIAQKYNLNKTVGAAAVLDKIFNRKPDGDLAGQFYTIASEQQAKNALIESLPMLSATSAQILSDNIQTITQFPTLQKCDVNKNVWVKTFNNHMRQNSHLGVSGYKGNNYGLALGVEACHSAKEVGLLMTYTTTNIHSYQTVAKHSLKAKTLQLGTYLNSAITPQLAVNLKAGMGYSNIDSSRAIKFVNRKATSNYESYFVYGGVGSDFTFIDTEKFKITPFIQLNYQFIQTDSYKEKGAKELNIHIKKNHYQSLVNSIGFNSNVQLEPQLSANVKIAANYQLMDKQSSTTAAFEGATDLDFTIKGPRKNRLSGSVGVNLNYHLTPMTKLSLDYQLVTSSGYTQHTPSLSLNMAF
ncbi:autotransporter domain-containing protein [Gallibacterium trehalosifermentans]|uniref:Autotransporter domain-containing protein n=1 Tax=Gallibacterium trehalosifermentans TaxID=516935 RepID=A0ABV6GYB3_9PAST